MNINPDTALAVRELIGHALRVEFDDLTKELDRLSDDARTDAIGHAAVIAWFVAVDDNGGTPPTSDELREVAHDAAEVEDRFTLSADTIHTYLSRCVFGDTPPFDALSAEEASRLPFIVAGNLLASVRADDEEWYEYLDRVEAAVAAAPDPS